MAIQRMDHVGVVVEDIAAATEFFVALGLEPKGRGTIEGEEVVDRIVGLEGVRTEVAFLQTPDGHGQIELVKFHAPAAQDGDPGAPAHATGLRHLTFAVDDLDATLAGLQEHGPEMIGGPESFGGYRLCYVRGPEGIILELAEKLG